MGEVTLPLHSYYLTAADAPSQHPGMLSIFSRSIPVSNTKISSLSMFPSFYMDIPCQYRDRSRSSIKLEFDSQPCLYPPAGVLLIYIKIVRAVENIVYCQKCFIIDLFTCIQFFAHVQIKDKGIVFE